MPLCTAISAPVYPSGLTPFPSCRSALGPIFTVKDADTVSPTFDSIGFELDDNLWDGDIVDFAALSETFHGQYVTDPDGDAAHNFLIGLSRDFELVVFKIDPGVSNRHEEQPSRPPTLSLHCLTHTPPSENFTAPAPMFGSV